MYGIPDGVAEEIERAIQRPEGTVKFTYTSEDLFNPSKNNGVVLQVIGGQHLFRIERDRELALHFYHSSPGTGTRLATIDLEDMPRVNEVFMAFTWSPKQIKFYVGPGKNGGELTVAEGGASPKRFQVGMDGEVYQIGDQGNEVMGLTVRRGDQTVVQSTAIEAWNETIEAVKVVGRGTSEEGELFEVVTANSALAILVTGYETYCKRRFLELEQEGIQFNTEWIIESFYSRHQRESGISTVLEEEARESDISVLRQIVSRGAINFQNYSDSKRAFNRGYGLKFGELGVPSDDIQGIQDYIRYRHRIIHVSALTGMLNQHQVPPEEPVFSNWELAQRATDCFDRFLSALHHATLELRPQ